MATATLGESEIHQLVREAFSDAPEQWRAPDIFSRAARNFEGEDALYVTAVFPDELGHPNGSERVDVQIKLGDLLVSRGDQRFVYLSTLTCSEFAELRDLESEAPLDAA